MYPTSVTFSGEGVTEWMSFVLYGVFHIAVFPSLTVVLGYSMASIPQITFEYKIKKYPYWWMMAISFVFYGVGSILGVVNDQERDYDEKVMLLKLLKSSVSFMSYFSSYCFLCFSSFLLVSWIAVLNDVILKQYNSSESGTGGINKCITLYSVFNESFGFLLFIIFVSSTFLTILSIFFLIASVLNEFQIEQIIMCFILLLTTFGYMTMMLAVTLSADGLHKNLLKLCENLDKLEEDLKEENERIRVRNLRMKILHTGPMTGMGFFNIDKNSFFGMLSFAATYIVILVQFKSGEKEN